MDPMRDCTVNIADFRSIHPMTFHKTENLAFLGPQKSAGVALLTPQSRHSDVRLKVEISGHRSVVLDIASNRFGERSSRMYRADARVLSFDDGYSSKNRDRQFAFSDSDDFDPCPPAA